MSTKTALVVIDVQMDYFPGFRFPLWNTANTLDNIVNAIRQADALEYPVILVQHAAGVPGKAPFFLEGSCGAELHPEILSASDKAIVVYKNYADAFHKTELEMTLQDLCVEKLLICGMMTHNCVTHTAISKTAEKYQRAVLTDCCTTVDDMMHLIALNALSIRVPLLTAAEAFK